MCNCLSNHPGKTEEGGKNVNVFMKSLSWLDMGHTWQLTEQGRYITSYVLIILKLNYSGKDLYSTYLAQLPSELWVMQRCVTTTTEWFFLVHHSSPFMVTVTRGVSDKICYPKSFKSAVWEWENRLQFPAAQREFPELEIRTEEGEYWSSSESASHILETFECR